MSCIQNILNPQDVTTLGLHGTAATATKLIDIWHCWCNHELLPAYLTNVRYNEKSSFNLASIGLNKMRDDAEGVILSKGKEIL